MECLSVGDFRKEHHQLASVVARVLKHHDSMEDGNGSREADDVDAIAEVRAAYDEIKGADVLDLTEQGTLAWDMAKKRCVAFVLFHCHDLVVLSLTLVLP
jgi:hypothetical protein